MIGVNLEISLTKHPKKKADPDDDPTNDNIPETEPVDTEDELSRRKRLLDRLFWIRIGLASIGGVVATFLFESIEGEERRWASIVFMIMIFVASALIGKGMKIGLPPSDRKKLITTGIGTYVFVYLFMWILSYTLVHHPSVDLTTIKPL